MGTIFLQKMVVRGFRSLAEEATVVFDKSGMVLVRGFNRDTQGSSGSGKSNVLLALAYAFDYCPLTSKEIQNWDLPSPPNVEVWFTVDDIPVYLQRGPKPLLIEAEKETTGARAVNARLQEVLGLSTDLLSALTFRQQKARGLFLSKKDIEKKEFLTTLLRLGEFESEYDKATKATSAISTKLEVLTSREQLLEEQYTVAKGRVTPLVLLDEVPLLKELSAAEVVCSATLSAKLTAQQDLDLFNKKSLGWVANKELTSSIAAFKAEYESRKSQAPRYIRNETEVKELSALYSEVCARLHASDKNIGTLHQSHRDLSNIVRSKERLQGELSKVKSQIAALNAAICPECERAWDSPQRLAVKIKEAEALEFRLTQVKEAELGLVELEKLQAEESGTAALLANVSGEIKGRLEEADRRLDLEQSEHEIAAINALHGLTQSVAQAEAILREERATWEASITKNKEIYGKKLVDAVEASSDSKTALLDVERCLERRRSQNSAIKSEADRNLRAAEEAEARWRVASTEYKVAHVEYAKEVDWAKAIKGFLGSVFDESLAAIADESNKLLALLPNTAHVTLSFKSEGITLKGKIEHEIKLVVSVNGHETTLAGCSGGQTTSIELAVDLAVAMVVQERTGTAPGWIILDETFEGLDEITKESCMELLKQYATKRLVLVVDHSSEFKELFTSFIDVEFTRGKSTIL